MVKKSDGHEAEDEVGIIPIPKVLMQDEKSEKDDEDDPFLIHECVK